ncbi:tetratricopeptide repeat protein [Fructobacillus cardui]|uniref:tetratricopeptide repeat protein n=1 Tax=Fructobacillus cardui TaxID=2893170 RepID=UPI0030C84CB1
MTNYAEEMMAAIRLGQMDQAQKAFQKSLAEDEDDLVYSLAEDLYAIGFVEESKKAYLHLLAKYPDEGDLKTALAELAIEENDLDLAQDYLAQISENSPAYLQALLVKADLYQSEGLSESAEYALEKASQLAPDEPVVTFALAEFYFTTGQYHQAIRGYRQLLLAGQRRIAKVDMAARIGTAYAAIGNVDNAIAYLEQIKPIDLTIDTKFQLAFLYVEKKADEDALPLFEDILAADPQYTSVYPLLGQLYEQINDLDQAEKTYRLGLSYDQTNPVLYRQAGLLAFKLGQYDQAKEDFNQALALDDQDLATYSALADLYLARHDYDAVIETIGAAQELDLVDPRFSWDLARAYHAKEEEDKAAEQWQAAQVDYPADPDFWHDLADWYHEVGRRKEELTALEKAVDLDPDNFELADRLADLSLD